MGTDLRSQLRAFFERELSVVLERAAGSDPLVRDRLALEVFSALLRDAQEHRDLLARDVEAQRAWLTERVDEAEAPRVGGEDPEEAGDCVRPAASGWVEQYFQGRLAPSSEPGLWGHLADCPACRVRYRALWDLEGEAGEEEALRKRTRRLARGLPWSEVPESLEEADPEEAGAGAEEGDPESEEEDPESEEEGEKAGGVPEHEGAQESEAEGAVEGPQRFWLTRRGRWIAYGLSAALAVLGSVLLVLAPEDRAIELEEETPATAVVAPLPDQGLTVALLRHDSDLPSDLPWRSVQGAVAAGDKLLLTYSLDEGKGKEKGRPRFLTIVAIDDRGRLHWLRPAVRTAGRQRSPAVTVPSVAAKLPQELRTPKGIERLVIYAVVTDGPTPLAVIQRALAAAFSRADFATTPPILNVDHSLQFHLVLDVLR